MEQETLYNILTGHYGEILETHAMWQCIAALGIKPFKDGNQWCFLYGNNIQEGISGFGETIFKAAWDFYTNIKTEEARKEEQNMKVYRSAYHKGDILRTDSGFEFVVNRVYRVSIFEQIYYSGYSPKDLGFIAGVKEEKCKKIGFDPNWEDYQRVRNK